MKWVFFCVCAIYNTSLPIQVLCVLMYSRFWSAVYAFTASFSWCFITFNLNSPPPTHFAHSSFCTGFISDNRSCLSEPAVRVRFSGNIFARFIDFDRLKKGAGNTSHERFVCLFHNANNARYCTLLFLTKRETKCLSKESIFCLWHFFIINSQIEQYVVLTFTYGYGCTFNLESSNWCDEFSVI